MASQDFKTAAKQATGFLASGWRISSTESNLVSETRTLFSLTNVQPKKKQHFKTELIISEDSNDRSTKVEASFGIKGSYGAFSGAAEASLDKFSASKSKTLRADHNLWSITWSANSDLLNFSQALKPAIIKYVKEHSVDKIVEKLGHFFAEEVSLGGHMQLTRIVASNKDDTSSSMRASIEASYSDALSGSVSGKASAGRESKSAVEGRNESTTIDVRGGDTKHWLAFTGAESGPGSKADCQMKWAASISSGDMYPLRMKLNPIWKAFEDGDAELQKKAKEIKRHLTHEWKEMKDIIAAAAKKKEPAAIPTRCKTAGHPMEACEASYNKWKCDECGNKRKNEVHWHCAQCHDDVCFRCKPSDVLHLNQLAL